MASAEGEGIPIDTHNPTPAERVDHFEACAWHTSV